MTPDSPLGKINERLTRLEQRVQDRIDWSAERFAEIAESFRTFAPLVQDHAKLRGEIEHLSSDFTELKSDVRVAIGEVRAGLDALDDRLEREEKDRAKVRQAREEKERERDRQEHRERMERKVAAGRDRWQRWALVLTLTLTAAGLIVNATGLGT